MLNVKSILVFLFMLSFSCIDRLEYEIPGVNRYGISISGLITDQPGPYQVMISNNFDIDSEEVIRTPLSAKRVVLSDNAGLSEELLEVETGRYETSASKMRGQVGRIYTLRVELSDGKVYESVPDTLLPAGRIDSVYFTFLRDKTSDGQADYGFDIFTNASRGKSNGNRFMWSMKGTYKATIDPELPALSKYGCNRQESGKCNFYPLCTGIRNIGPGILPLAIFERVGPCECCTCWYSVFNYKPILNDQIFTQSENYTEIKTYHVPLSGWIFMYQFHVEVKQFSLTDNAFRFWKSIRDQQNANGDIFQPVIGKIPINFIQLSGEDSPVQGLFYAAGMVRKTIYIKQTDVPNTVPIPVVSKPNDVGNCLALFPNATTIKPDFWIE